MKSNLTDHITALETLATALRGRSIVDLFNDEPQRHARFSFAAAGIELDISKQLVSDTAKTRLLALAENAGLNAAKAAMFNGDVINHSEQRAVLHTALRRAGRGRNDDNVPHAAAILSVQERMAALVRDIHSGARCGFDGSRFTDVVNIGIGGSHLGPQLACDALRFAGERHLRTHFLANVDGGEFARIVDDLDPRSTLFIVASKSFTTVETRLNATSARAWLAAATAEPQAVAQHFIAVSANVEGAVEFGIDADNVYPMWDWVGGRYSMWSAIGLPVALAFGMAVFDQLLAGAADMDEHFLHAPVASNLPAILALVGIWNTNFLGADSYAVVPYDDRLRYLPDYLQQLEMESNGKRVSNAHELLPHDTAPVTWGGLGTNAQHAFFQLLHQGTRFIPIDFIVAMQHPVAPPAHHDMLVANCFAQAEGLMRGTTADAAGSADLHRATPGNRPSTMLTLEALTPASLGALIALYEHKTFVQSVIWDINAFDQWGVELGKQLATTILADITATGDGGPHDPSTAALIARYRSLRGR